MTFIADAALRSSIVVPLFWVACSRLRRESEQACDDAVLASGVPPAQYAAQLVEIARTCRQSLPTWTLALPIARPSSCCYQRSAPKRH